MSLLARRGLPSLPRPLPSLPLSLLPRGLPLPARLPTCRQLTLSPALAQQLKPREGGGALQASQGERAKEGAKTASYSLVIVGGLGMAGYVLYVVLRELFSSNSPNTLYDRAVSDCLKNEKLLDLLGEPVKDFKSASGEVARRGQRNRVASTEYRSPEGRRGVRLQFFLKGGRNRGTATLDSREDSSGSMQTRFLVVEVEDMLRNTVVITDSRRTV